nr:cellulose synthase operon protein YhjQ/BcsQ [uncultured Lichenicoccus sp.]
MSGAGSSGPSEPTRHDRSSMIAFVNDGETETALREGLAEVAGMTIDVRRGGVKGAMATMRKIATPRMLIIDVSGEAHPLTALASLADIIEPEVQVLVTGDARDVDFYRQVTRGLGSAEYLPKPLTRDMVSRHFAPLMAGQTASHEIIQGGRMVTVTGVRGGTGATTIAVHLAWHFAVDMRRHTALLDPDLHMGNMAMLLNSKATGGLRTALENPDRLDELFVERAAQPIENSPQSERLHVLAGACRMTDDLNYSPGAATRLTQLLQRRYGFVVADVPFRPSPLYRDLMALGHQRILVMEPSLSSIRDTLRLLSLPNSPNQTRRAIIVLNRLGQNGGLTRRQVEDALKMAPDVVIADLPKQIAAAATLGEPAAAMKGGFRAGILELARQAAFERLLDGQNAKAQAESKQSVLPKLRLFGRAA